MKAKFKLFVFLGLTVIIPNLNSFSQVSINTTGNPPDNSAILDVSSTTKGKLVPRMTTGEIEAIYDPADGLIVYCTTDHKLYAFISSENKWMKILVGSTTVLPPLRCGIDMLNDTRDGNNWKYSRVFTCRG